LRLNVVSGELNKWYTLQTELNLLVENLISCTDEEKGKTICLDIWNITLKHLNNNVLICFSGVWGEDSWSDCNILRNQYFSRYQYGTKNFITLENNSVVLEELKRINCWKYKNVSFYVFDISMYSPKSCEMFWKVGTHEPDIFCKKLNISESKLKK
jgi:hypothetical protein